MRGFFYKVQSALSRFMYGRNGADQLNRALLVLYLVVWLAGTLLASLLQIQALISITNILMMVLAVLLIFRTFSRNLPKRRAENERYLAWWLPRRARVSGARERRRDKTHRYFTCKSCGTICRVPAGKGKLEITCPKCGRKILGKS